MSHQKLTTNLPTDSPPDPGIKPGGIRDRAMRALRARGPIPEDEAKTKASQEFWRTFRAKRERPR